MTEICVSSLLIYMPKKVWLFIFSKWVDNKAIADIPGYSLLGQLTVTTTAGICIGCRFFSCRDEYVARSYEGGQRCGRCEDEATEQW